VILFTVRILPLDVGEKRIGIAVSNHGGKIAQAVKIYIRRSSSEDLKEIKELSLQPEVSRIVEGLPKNLDGSLGTKAKVTVHVAEIIERATGVGADPGMKGSLQPRPTGSLIWYW
jgi:putative Holliday junction resolvase